MLVKEKPILILGVGNLLLKDEGIGVHVVRRLKEIELPHHVEVLDGGTGGLDLLESIAGREKVIVIDTVKAGQPPGTLYRFSSEDIKDRPKSWLSLHDIDITDLLKLADMLEIQKPNIVVIGIEPKDMDSADLKLSPEIKAKIPKVIELVKEEINNSSCHSERSEESKRIISQRDSSFHSE